MNKFIDYINGYNPYSNVYGFARTIIACATLLTLLFNDTTTLLTYTRNNLSCEYITVPSLFCIANQLGISLEIVRFMMIFCLIVIASGWRPRYTGIIHWYICYTLQWSATTIDGGEQINTVLTFLLIPITLLDSRKNHFIKLKENSASIYSKYITWLFILIIKIQVFVIYLNAALERLKNSEWSDGTALYYFFSDPIFGLPPYQLTIMEPILNSYLVIPLTWGVTIFELFLVGCALFPDKIKSIGYYSGIIFHVAIIFTIGIVTFGITMVAAIILYLRPWDKEFSFDKVGNFALNPFKGINQKRVIENSKHHNA